MSNPSASQGEEIGLFEAIHTQRAIRSFRPDPIPREVLEQIVESATRAPSGANSQPWAFVIVQDEAMRRQLAEYARIGFAKMYETAKANQQPGDPEPFSRLGPMIEAFEIIPAIAIVCGVGKGEEPATPWPVAMSVLPAIQNFLLAARGLGVGAALTTGWAGPRRKEIAALLKLPPNVVPLAYIPLGYPDKERYGPTTRRPISEVLHWDTYSELGNSAKLMHR